ncbi:hypothetical protein [Streptomyces finlayi]|uniref:hypothetical protein n=1 Tax=Streptomyces finlayi TaxID=67296 RepID=UPI0027E54E55|nr:hypothetical protein [Streptomyces finlayi]
MAASLLVGAVGCGGGDEGAKAADEKPVAAEKLCGGAVSTEARKALEVITGSTRFEKTDETSTVAHAAEEMIGVFSPLSNGSSGGNGDVCRIYTPAGTTGDELRVTWHLSLRDPGNEKPAPKFTPLDMGEGAGAAPDEAFVGLACRGEKLPGSAQNPGHIRIGVQRMGMPKEAEGDIEALTRAYATVTHSVSLAVAKQLGCEGEAGLGPRASFEPA